MNARSALFDLYGDHLRSRGGQAPVAALVRLLAPLGVAAPAVRTAVSRMVRQEWLEPARLPGGPGYALTPRAVRWLDDAAARIYRTRAAAWDGHWHLLVVTPPAGRPARERLRAGLGFLGYAPLAEDTWLSPRPAPELADLLERAAVRADRFTARHGGDSLDLVRRAWDLDGLAAAYRRWTGQARRLLDGAGPAASAEESFAVRSRLVHEWRKFLFADPGLPRELLPADWPGDAAAALFDQAAATLAPGAARFVDACLTAAAWSPAPRRPGPTASTPGG